MPRIEIKGSEAISAPLVGLRFATSDTATMISADAMLLTIR